MHPAQRIVAEMGRRCQTAKGLSAQLAALDFGKSAMDEARARAIRIVNRVLPATTGHGFYAPAAFVDASIRHGERAQLHKSVEARILAKIIARDDLFGDDVAARAAESYVPAQVAA